MDERPRARQRRADDRRVPHPARVSAFCERGRAARRSSARLRACFYLTACAVPGESDANVRVCPKVRVAFPPCVLSLSLLQKTSARPTARDVGLARLDECGGSRAGSCTRDRPHTDVRAEHAALPLPRAPCRAARTKGPLANDPIVRALPTLQPTLAVWRGGPSADVVLGASNHCPPTPLLRGPSNA